MSYSKYRVSRKEDRTYNGIVFDSKAELKRYCELLLLVKAGEIRDLKTQEEYLLQPAFIYNKQKIREIKYTADFVYTEGDKLIIEEVKSKITAKLPDYIIRKKLFMRRLEGSEDICEFRELIY